jgi:thioredoxin reductase (NADPH)
VKIRPFIVVVDDDEQSLDSLVEELNQRYARDYDVVGDASGHSAIEALHQFAKLGRDVAVVLADFHLGEASGVDVLVVAREVHPKARRGLLVDWSERLVTEEVARASVLGFIDHHLAKPVHNPDETWKTARTSLRSP